MYKLIIGMSGDPLGFSIVYMSWALSLEMYPRWVFSKLKFVDFPKDWWEESEAESCFKVMNNGERNTIERE